MGQLATIRRPEPAVPDTRDPTPGVIRTQCGDLRNTISIPMVRDWDHMARPSRLVKACAWLCVAIGMVVMVQLAVQGRIVKALKGTTNLRSDTTISKPAPTTASPSKASGVTLSLEDNHAQQGSGGQFSAPSSHNTQDFGLEQGLEPLKAAASGGGPEGSIKPRAGEMGMSEIRTVKTTPQTTPNLDGVGSGGARIGYLIMASGAEEVVKVKRLLKAIYHPRNFYVVHLDRKTEDFLRVELEHHVLGMGENARMLTPAIDVSWGGYTITLTAIFGLCTLVQWSTAWDYFINISASDFPLMSQPEMSEVLGLYMDKGLSFVAGAPLNERNRAEVYVDDQGIYRTDQIYKAGRPIPVQRAREPPSSSMFTIFKGEFWVTLHRSVCEYIESSPDNVARMMQAYFSRYRISDESYFQTVLCHPQAPDFPVHNDNLRYVAWPWVGEGHYVLHPNPITPGNLAAARNSGGFFARKFTLEDSSKAYNLLEQDLFGGNLEHHQLRLSLALRRVDSAQHTTGRLRFCKMPKDYDIGKVLAQPKKAPPGSPVKRIRPKKYAKPSK